MNKTTKTVVPRIWKGWKIVSEATAATGQIRKDETGRHWEWMSVIQNIRVRLVPGKGKTLVEVLTK